MHIIIICFFLKNTKFVTFLDKIIQILNIFNVI